MLNTSSVYQKFRNISRHRKACRLPSGQKVLKENGSATVTLFRAGHVGARSEITTETEFKPPLDRFCTKKRGYSQSGCAKLIKPSTDA